MTSPSLADLTLDHPALTLESEDHERAVWRHANGDGVDVFHFPLPPDLGASLGGGGANTVFGTSGAGNFLTKITTGSAITFMCTSLALAYLGYENSDVQLFDGDAPIEVPIEGGLAPVADEAGGLEEIPTEESGGLMEIPMEADAVEDAAADAAEDAP